MTAKKKPKGDTFDGAVQPAMHPEMWPLHKIVPYPMNPRSHPPAQITLLAELFKLRGIDQPIVVDDQGVILKGHGRRLAALAAGMDEFPVIVRRGLTDVEKSAIRIEDNATALLSSWDQELTRAEISMLKTEGYDLQLLGFGESQLVQFTTTPGPPAAFQSVDGVETSYCCPKCGFEWSGSPKPKAKEPKKNKKKNGKAK